MSCPVVPPDFADLTPREQIKAFAEAIRPHMKAQGLEAYCNASVWLEHAELRKAIREEEDLILSWPDGTTTLHYALSLAMLEPIPTPKAQQGAQYFRHKLKARARAGN